jgi:hypothetical protein
MPGSAKRRNQPERAFRRNVKEAAQYAGWTILLEIPDSIYRILFGRGGSPATIEAASYFAGWPDLLLGRRDRGVIAVELKSGNGVRSAKQEAKAAQLAEVGIPVYLWRDTDDFDAISTFLQQGRF